MASTKPKITVNVREKDFGLSHILKEAAKLRKKPFVKVGIAQTRGSKLRADGKQTVADIAAIHEFGAPKANIPERSFIRSTVNHNEAKYDGLISKLKDQIFDANAKMTVEKALGLVGQSVSSDMKNTIRTNQAGLNGPTGLKEATIRSKNAGEIAKAKAHLNAAPSAKDFTKAGSARNAKAAHLVDTGGASTPLIDTSQMIRSISYEVSMTGSETAIGPKTFEENAGDLK